MKDIHSRIRRMKALGIILLLGVFVFSSCSGCGQKIAPEPLTDAQQDAEGGHFHADGTWHTEPHTQPPQIDVPEDDPFFASIIFPDTPPYRPHGHYVQKQSPFKLPDVVRNNPHLFKVDENGRWHPIYPPEKLRKLEQIQGSGLKGDAYTRQIAEIIAKGLDPLPAALFVMRNGLAKKEAKRLIEKARAENPNDFDTLDYWCDMNKREKPIEVEAIYRGMLEMRPESMRALYALGSIILENHQEPQEAIPYLEKAYHLNPSWHGAIYVLGEVYFKLGNLEKALKYFQASVAFTGPTDGTSLYIPIIKRELAKRKKG